MINYNRNVFKERQFIDAYYVVHDYLDVVTSSIIKSEPDHRGKPAFWLTLEISMATEHAVKDNSEFNGKDDSATESAADVESSRRKILKHMAYTPPVITALMLSDKVNAQGQPPPDFPCFPTPCS